MEVCSRTKPAELKAMSNLAHSAYRLEHRFDFDGQVVKSISAAIAADASGDIPLHEVKLLRPDFVYANRSLYAVLIDGEWVPVVWCSATKSPVSVLPKEALDPYLSVLRIKPDLQCGGVRISDIVKSPESIDLPGTSAETELAISDTKARLTDCNKKLSNCKGDSAARETLLVEFRAMTAYMSRLKLHLKSVSFADRASRIGIDPSDELSVFQALYDACNVMANVLNPAESSDIRTIMKAALPLLEKKRGQSV